MFSGRGRSVVRKSPLAVAVAAVLAMLLGFTASAGSWAQAPAAATTPSGSGLPPLRILEPGLVGGFVTELPVNIVFVGHRPGQGPDQVDQDAFLADLPEFTDTVVRNGLPLVTRRLGITFVPTYHVQFADEGFEDALFAEFLDLAEPTRITDAMFGYNLDPAASRVIEDAVAIDAVSVERWLGDHAAELDLDPADPTVFLIDWSNRPDFRFHYFRGPRDPHPDHGPDLSLDQSRALSAFGGTAADDPQSGDGHLRRLWFHDLSAGPDEITGGWDLSTADLRGDGVTDYRIPPAWEYGNAGYRAFDDLTGDLARVVRYIAVNLLFAPSALYHPAISAPDLPRSISIDVTHITPPQATPGQYALPETLAALRRLQPRIDFRLTQRADSLDGRLAAVYDCWRTAFAAFPPFLVRGTSCYGQRTAGFAYYDLFLWSFDRWPQLTTTDTDHSVPVLFFDLPDDPPTPLAGLADGRTFYDYGQAEVLEFTSPSIRSRGVGPTRVLTHEVGHHLGISHPHDGVDAEQRIFYGPAGDFFFAWLGDEVSSVMSYTDLEGDFSQFDVDAMDRYLTVVNLNYANQILANIAASPRASKVATRLSRADQAAYAAVVAYVERDWRTAAQAAQRAFDLVAEAAHTIRVPVEPESRPADAKSRSLRAFFGDPIPPDFIDPSLRVPGLPRQLPAETVGAPTRNWATQVG